MEQRTYHNRLVNLLLNTSSKVIRRVFLFLIQTHKDYRDLNDFLQKKKIELERKRLGKLNLKTLFPTRKRPTDLGEWDLQLLCFIVCDIFKPEFIVQSSVDYLRCIRNILCHGSSTNISKVYYEKYVRRIRKINDELLSRIGDKNFEREIANETDDIIHDKLDISGALETIRDWYELDESHKERCTFDKVHRQALEKMKQNPTTSTATTPETKLILKVENCAKEQEINISKRLTNVINSKRSKSEVLDPPTDIETAELSRIVEEAFIEILDEGQFVVKTDVGCVILTVKSGSFASIEQLWTKCMNGELTKAFDTLKSYLRRIYKNQVELEVLVPEHEFWEVIDTIDESLEFPSRSCLEGKVMDVITRQLSENGTEIEMVIQPHSEKQLEHMKEYNASGKLDASLKKMAKRLEDQFNLEMLTISSIFSLQGSKGADYALSADIATVGLPETVTLPTTDHKDMDTPFGTGAYSTSNADIEEFDLNEIMASTYSDKIYPKECDSDDSAFEEIEVNPNKKQTYKRYHHLESYEYTRDHEREDRGTANREIRGNNEYVPMVPVDHTTPGYIENKLLRDDFPSTPPFYNPLPVANLNPFPVANLHSEGSTPNQPKSTGSQLIRQLYPRVGPADAGESATATAPAKTNWFEPDKELLMKSLMSTPVELHERPSGYKVKATFVRNINVSEISNLEKCDITGLVVISSDIMVVCDSRNSSVKFIDTKENIVTSQVSLPSPPWETALVPPDFTEKPTTYDLIVTLPAERKLRYVQVNGDQITDTNKDISVEGWCRGIQVTQDRKLVVSYGFPGKVEILDMDGQVLWKLVRDHGGDQLFHQPWYLAVSPGSGILYVSDCWNNTLTSISTRHWSVMTKLKGLDSPQGVTVDRAGSVFVCCKNGTVHLVAATGDLSTQILGEEDGLCKRTWAIGLSPEGDRMYVSGLWSDHVQEFQLTEN